MSERASEPAGGGALPAFLTCWLSGLFSLWLCGWNCLHTLMIQFGSFKHVRAMFPVRGALLRMNKGRHALNS